jgi:hypothetical protein
MAQRMVRFYHLTNRIIEDGQAVRLVIEQHPALTNGPVEIEIGQDEIAAIRDGALHVVSLKLYDGDGSVPKPSQWRSRNSTSLPAMRIWLMSSVRLRRHTRLASRASLRQPPSIRSTTRHSRTPESHIVVRRRMLKKKSCETTSTRSTSDSNEMGSGLSASMTPRWLHGMVGSSCKGTRISSVTMWLCRKLFGLFVALIVQTMIIRLR